MASTVFGTPITKEYLQEMGEYKDATQKTLARTALLTKNADGKDISARKYAENLVPLFGVDKVSTLCFIYNATGDPVTFVTDHNWAGRICESPYPVIIQNGQWGAFLHGQYYGDQSGSSAAVVYSGTNSHAEECYWVMCFSNNPRGDYNEVYTEVCKPLDYNLNNNESSDWDSLQKKFLTNFGKSVHKSCKNGGLSFGSIGNVALNCYYEAILTLPDVLF